MLQASLSLKLKKHFNTLSKLIPIDNLSAYKEHQFHNALISSFENSIENSRYEERELVVLVCDLRDFSAISEKHKDIVIVKMINRYFTVMNKILVTEFGARIDKYMGDSILAVFSENDTIENGINNAVTCAAKMQLAMDEINAHNEALGLEKLYMGIAINCGKCIMTKVGSNIHNEYTVMGDVINTVSRIEAFTLRGQVLLAREVAQRASKSIRCEKMNKVHVRGKEEPIYFCELLDVEYKGNLVSVPKREVRRSKRIHVTIPIYYQEVDNKRIQGKVFEALSVDISYDGMLIELEHPVALYAELSIKPFFAMNLTAKIYAKVLRVRSDDNKIYAHLEFSSMDDQCRELLCDYINTLIDKKGK